MDQGPSWEANRSLTSQEIHRILWKPKLQNRIYKTPQLIPNVSQINPLHTPSHF